MASNVHVTKSSPEDYRDNPARLTPAGYAHPDREYQPPVEIIDWRVVLAHTLALLAAYAVYSLWKTSYCWSGVRYGACESIAAYEPLAIGAGLLLCAALMAWHHTAKIQIVQAQANRTNLVLDRYRNPMPADLFRTADPNAVLRYIAARYAVDTQLERDTAEHKRLWSVNTLSGDGQTTISTNVAPMLGDGSEPSTAITPDSIWLPWIDQTPHLLIAGRTNAGKTTLAKAILAERANQDEQLLILDPHDQPRKWFDLRAVGGGRDFCAVLCALNSVLEEMDRRFKDFDNGKQTEEFDRLTVLIDEVPALVASTMDGAKTTDGRWKSFAKKLGSEARKVRISAILLTQSPLVQDVQINSYMRENFTRVALGDQVSALLNEETNKERKQLLCDAMRGLDYAAAMEYRNEIHILDTGGIVTRASRRPTARMWIPAAAQRAVAAASVRPSATMRATFTPADLLAVPPPDGRTADGQRTRLYLKAMAAHGKTREYARNRMAMLNMPFENKLWTDVRRELGLGEG